MRQVKQYYLRAYYDAKLRGLEDSICLDEDDDINGWIWQKACEGSWVVVDDRFNGEEKYYRPVEETDEFIEDLEM